MIITVFKKKVTPKNGNKPFNKYITTLTNKQGETFYTEIRFADSVTIPKEFPCVLDVEKSKANLSKKVNKVTSEQGEEKEYTRYTLWVNEIKNISKYIDHSLDDFD